MQLRKVCNHPYLFDGIEPEGSEVYGEHLVEASGKLKLVDEILKNMLNETDEIKQIKNVDFIFRVCIPLYFLYDVKTRNGEEAE